MIPSAPPVAYRSSVPPSDQIAYLQGDGNYTWVFLLNGQKLLFAMTLLQMHSQHWPEFIRVHKSYAVNPRAVSGVTVDLLSVEVTIVGAGSLLIERVQIPIARRRKPAIEQLVKVISSHK